MAEEVKRLNSTVQTRSKLFALSGNRCAFPGCPHPIVGESKNLLAEICHIEGAKKGSERFNARQTNEQRRAFKNLILLCPTHHVVTNDVGIYTVDVMWRLKADHEKSATGVPIDPRMEESFIDHNVVSDKLPDNLKQLDLSYCEIPFFQKVNRLLDRIAGLPQRTRSLYAYALVYAIPGDLYLCVNPLELSLRLRQSREDLDAHFGILEQVDLVTSWEEDEGKNEHRISGRRYYFRGLDRDDNGIYFLYLMRKRFFGETEMLVDIIENLNFPLLDQ